MEQVEKFMPTLAILAGILFAAFFPITAVVLALGLAFEDLWAFVRGDDSMLGRMVDWFTKIEERIEDVIVAWYALRSAMTIGDHADYYAQQAADTIQKIRMARDGGMAPSLPMGAGVLKEPPQPPSAINSNITFNIDGSKEPDFIVDQMKNFISTEHRKIEKGQFRSF